MSSQINKSPYHDASDSESLLSSSEKTYRNSSDNGENGFIDGTTSPRPTSRFSRVLAIMRENWWIVDFTGLSIIIILLVGIYNNRPLEAQIGGDVSGFAPRFSHEITMFRPDARYFPTNPEDWFLSPTVQQTWLDLVPIGLGYISIPNPELYTPLPSQPLLPLNTTTTSSSTNEKENNENDSTNQYSPNPPQNPIYTTSLTHQLHCLHALATIHYSLLSSPPRDPPEETLWHAPHCFDYLRQAILCAGDVALEGRQTTFPEGWEGSDGWDARHVCKSYGGVKGFLEGVRVDDRVWI